MRLNLGCSDSLRGGEWLNVDIALGKEAVLFGDTKVAQIEVDPTRRGPDGKGCLGTVKSVVAYKFQQADLALPWPWDDSSVDEIYAADIFEHIGDCQHSGDQWCGQCMEDRRGEYLPGRARGFRRHPDHGVPRRGEGRGTLPRSTARVILDAERAPVLH